MSSSVLVFNDLLKLDLYRRDTVEAAVNELETLAHDLNKASIFYTWTVGKFIRSDLLKTKFHTNVETVAGLMGTTRSTLYRYGTVFDMLTEGEVIKLSTMGCSANAVLALADQYKVRPEEAKVTRDRLLSGELITAKDVINDFDSRILDANRPHQLLPAGESPEADPAVGLAMVEAEIVSEDNEAAVGQKMVDKSAEELDDDDDTAGGKSQQELDAKSCMRSAKAKLAEFVRHLTWLSDNTEELFDKLEDLSNVIVGSEELADESRSTVSTQRRMNCRAGSLIA